MVLKITLKQRVKINALVRRTCCNCRKGNCLLLDDGEEAKCVQLISRYGIYCNYFLKAVNSSVQADLLLGGFIYILMIRFNMITRFIHLGGFYAYQERNCNRL